MKTSPWYPLCGVVALLLVCSVSVRAVEDDKTFPGAFCKSQFSTDSTQIINGRLFNRSNAVQVWTCPMVRAVTGENVTVEFARITVVTRHAGEALACTLFSRTPGGADHATSGAISDRGFPNKPPVDFTFGAGDANTVSGVEGGYYYFECRIPGIDPESGQASGIVSYRLTENEGEN